jgi:hypothetical protein
MIRPLPSPQLQFSQSIPLSIALDKLHDSLLLLRCRIAKVACPELERLPCTTTTGTDERF